MSAGPPYSDFNIEQKAQIVQEWFTGNNPVIKERNRSHMDESSLYFRYIDGNIMVSQINDIMITDCDYKLDL